MKSIKGITFMIVLLFCRWKKNISNCKSFEELPVEARDYVNRIE